jgi:hypothetical protein
MRSYVHYGTGNYHPVTAKIYTDLSFFTTDPALCRDAARLFNFVSGYAQPEELERDLDLAAVARARLLEHIEEEIAHAKAGRPAQIWAKLNSSSIRHHRRPLSCQPGGVQIDLVMRGICCLQARRSGLSDNIRSRASSAVSRAHSRIVCFGAASLPHPRARGLHFLGRLDAAQSPSPGRDARSDRNADRSHRRCSTRSWSPISRTISRAGSFWPTAPRGASSSSPERSRSMRMSIS